MFDRDQARVWLRLLTGAALLGAVLTGTARADEKTDAKEADARAKSAVAEFKKTKDGKDPSGRVEAIGRLAEVPHPSTVAAVGKYLRDPREGVGSAAAAAIGRMGKALSEKDRGVAVKALAGGLGSKSADSLQACCKALAEIGDARGAAVLLPLLKDKDATRAAAAVSALGELKGAVSVDPLIDLLKEVEPPGAKGGGGGNAKASSQTEGQKARTTALQQPCLDALGKITGQAHKTAAEWKTWWKTNKAKFVAEEKRAAAESRATAKKGAEKPPEKPPAKDDDPGDGGGDGGGDDGDGGGMGGER